jgi:hypothetical protein
VGNEIIYITEDDGHIRTYPGIGGVRRTATLAFQRDIQRNRRGSCARLSVAAHAHCAGTCARVRARKSLGT